MTTTDGRSHIVDMSQALAHLHDRYGGAQAYLSGGGVRTFHVSAVRERLTATK